MANLFDNWRAAWASLIEDAPQDDLVNYQPTPTQACVMDNALGNAKVTLFYDEVLGDYQNWPELGEPLALYRSSKVGEQWANSYDLIVVYANAVVVEYAGDFGNSGTSAAYVKS